MTTLYSLLTFAFWGIADLFYKKGNIKEEKYNDIKTGIFVGIVMGIHALIYMIVNSVNIDFIEILKYLPVSLCYIISMIIGYKGLKYIELSIASPVQNTSGVITSILLLIFFKELLPWPAYIAFVLIFVAIFYICMLERKEDKEERKFEVELVKNKKVKILAIVLPILYCVFDGLGTFLDGVYLDKLELISEDNALICYEFTFLLFALFALLFLWHKKERIKFSNQKEKIGAAIFETAGQFFYVFAMAENSTISASIVGSYCILSMILSRIFLKEKLSLKKYIAIGIAIVGLIILCVLDV
ncbi:MAG: EamA family transporter [Clostridia bacterium]|nr:EamA family transporter [Clostridia bacterium]